MGYSVAVVGARGKIGVELLNILLERAFPYTEIYAVSASGASAGKKVSLGYDKELAIQDIDAFDFSMIDVSFFCCPSQVSSRYVEKALAGGGYVVDLSSHYRMHENVPLVVPGVNDHMLSEKNYKLVANSNCIAGPLSCILSALDELAEIKYASASTYQSVSGAGAEAMNELYTQTKGKFTNTEVTPRCFPKQIAFNIIPAIGDVLDDGYYSEEDKILQEVRKISGNVLNTVTSVRVPVFLGHSVSLAVEFAEELAENPAEYLNQKEYITVCDQYVVPIEVAGKDDIYVSRIMQHRYSQGMTFWLTFDNLRRGGAFDAVRLAEMMLKINR